ncbi:MAG: hypothetical protein GKS03_03840 [Alphaproteobacteria bacterium]|nr:hypothetical protein [Alphaproteobacteria bacterium]
MEQGRLHLIWTDECGAAGFVIAILFAVAAVGVAVLLLGTEPQRELANTRTSVANLTKIEDAMSVYATQDAAQLLPCPADGSVTGGARGFAPAPIGGACTINAGIVPFRSLGLSESDVTDAYGTVVTLIVDDLSLDVCNGTTGRAGNLTLFGGSQPNALYAVVSHGENKRGGYTGAGVQISVSASAVEADNCADGSACTDPDTVSVTVGPHNDDGNSDLHFDDRVLVAGSTDFDSLCLSVHGP